jgi:hypothetical protein
MYSGKLGGLTLYMGLIQSSNGFDQYYDRLRGMDMFWFLVHGFISVCEILFFSDRITGFVGSAYDYFQDSRYD